MTAPEPTKRLLDRYLADGPETVAERVIDAALDDIEHTPQRRAWGVPWRTTEMPSFFKIALAGAAVVAAVVAGTLFLGRLPTQEVANSSDPSTRPAPSGASTRVEGRLESRQGTLTVRFDLPADWSLYDADSISAFRPEEGQWPAIGFDLMLVENVYADGCHPSALADPPVGPTVDDLVAWLQADADVELSEPRAVTLAGHPGVQLDVVRIPASECVNRALWPSGRSLYALRSGPFVLMPELDDRLVVLDVDGRRVVVAINGMAGPQFQDRLVEAQAVLDTLSFE